MSKFDYLTIEKKIGYVFNNKKLLRQAFFRSSYAHENSRVSNEVLEFIGDKVIDYAVVRIFVEKYGKKKEGYFNSSKEEGELSSLKAELVSSQYLASIVDMLDISDYIFYGRSDINNNAINSTSAKEDLFEAIIGAIALDTNWDMDIIIDRVNDLLRIERFLKGNELCTNYVGLVQEATARIGLKEPTYDLKPEKPNGEMVWRATLRIKGFKHTTQGIGYKQKEAKKEAARQMLVLLEKTELDLKRQKKKDEDYFAMLNSLVQGGIIDEPEFEYSNEYDENGNPYWKCDMYIPYRGYMEGYGYSKKEAKKDAIRKAIPCL